MVSSRRGIRKCRFLGPSIVTCELLSQVFTQPKCLSVCADGGWSHLSKSLTDLETRPMNKIPEHAIRITTFDEFRDDIAAFAKGKYNSLLVIGNNGLSKTEAIRSMVENPLVLTGEPTAWKLYQELHDHRDSTVILDDVSTKFYRDSKSLAYLKQLMETKQVKTLKWQTNAAGDGLSYPSEFDTTSKVAILTNSWDSINEHVRAVEGRATTIVFDPSPEEVHREVGRGGWFKDQEVFDFVWENQGLITKPNMRLYTKILEQKRAGRPWRSRGIEMMVGDGRLNQIAQLLADPTFKNNTQRCKRFIELGYGKRATFYNLLKEFRFYKPTSESEPPVLIG